MATKSRPPVAMPAHSGGRKADRSPVFSTATAVSPSSVPATVPRPPKMLVPPKTTAVMADSSNPVPASALACPARAA